MVQQSARGSLILLMGQVLSTVILAFGTIIVARLLGSTDYGVLTVATIPISVVTMLGDIGVNASLVKYIAQYRSERRPDEIRAMMRAGLVLNFLVTAILSLATYLLSGYLAADLFHNPEIKLLIEIGSLSLFAQSTLTTCQFIFIGFERMELHSLTVISYSALKSILSLVLVLVGYGAFGAVVAGAASFILTAMMGILIVTFVFTGLGKSVETILGEFRPYRTMLGYGFPLYLSNLIAGGLTQLFNFLTAVYVEASLIGNYQAALNFSVLIGFMTMPITTVLFPLFSKLDLDGDSPLEFVFQSSIKYSSLILVPATMGLMILSDHVVRIIYGNSYQLAPLFLQLNLVNMLFAGFGSLSVGSLLNSQGKTKISFTSNLIYLCVGLPMGLLLIPRFGVVGLLLTSIIASKPSLVYVLWWIKKNLGLSVNWGSSTRIYFSSGLAFLVVFLTSSFISLGDWLDLILGAGIFFVLYSLLLPSSGALDRGDIGNLRSIMKALGPLAPFFNLFLAVISRFTREAKVRV